MKRYILEAGSEDVRSWTAGSPYVATSMVAYAEARAAIGRRRREGDVPADRVASAIEQLDDDWPSFVRIAVQSRLARRAGALAEAHRLRGFDAIHLASAERAAALLGATRFAAYDTNLNRAAAERGFEVLGPTD